jgi:glycosyltransferase involved in cell wall biosynthesis
MRILHLADRLSERGGAYRHLLAVARAQAAAGHAVWLAGGSCDAGFDPGLPTLLDPALASRTRARGDWDALQRGSGAELVHLHTVVNPEAIEWAAARPSLATVQDHRCFCPSRGKWTLAGAACREPMRPEACRECFEDTAYFEDTLALTRARLEALRRLPLVVLSRYMRAELLALGVAAEVIPPFADGLDAEARADGPPCIAFVGRLTESKGARDAAAAWRRSGVTLPLVVAGAGPLRQELERAGAQVLGWLDRTRLSALLKRARALLMPSRWQEPFGIAGLEALSFGVPVAGYDSGGIREWHPGPGLVAWGDVEALAGELRQAVARRERPPAGFARKELMARLDALYARVIAA